MRRRQVDDLLHDVHRLPGPSPVLVAILLDEHLHRPYIPLLVLLDRLRLVREQRANNEVPVLLMLRRVVEVKHETVTIRQRLHVLRIRLVEPLEPILLSAEHEVDALDCLHSFRYGYDDRLAGIVALQDAEVGKVLLRRLRREEGEERVYAVRGVVTREVTHEQLWQSSAERAVVGIAGTVEVAPRREVGS